MIRSFSLLLGLFGLLLQTASAASPQDDLCKVEQDHINTAIYIDGVQMTQNLRTCAKGTISMVEIIASAEFNGGFFDVAILDDTFTPKAMHTITADNYNGTSFVLNNLSIPTLMNEQFTLVVRAQNGASCVVPGTEDADMFVGEARLQGQYLAKNAKFTLGVRSATPQLNEANDGRKADVGNINPPTNAMSRNAAGLDLDVSGDCHAAQRQSNGVLNVVGGSFLQTFYACDRGRVVEAKLAAPFVKPGFDYTYTLAHFNGDVLAEGTFTSEDVTDGELSLTFDKGSVRKGQQLSLRVNCPEGSRIALLAKGVDNTDFGRLYMNGHTVPFNIAMAAGLESATAEDVLGTDDGRAALSLTAYPIPFGDALSAKVRGTVQEGARLQVLDHQGMPIKSISLTAGQLEAPVRFTDLGDLRPGIYSLRLLSGRQSVSIRILKG
ncbi:MAG: T9SS type A sorting domain-containing protein [Flavobacteriales bacterium]|nr:T9SS type A sorting domain-containing protein [Flavobacteriales bacterium]